jgi:hypothetical protein
MPPKRAHKELAITATDEQISFEGMVVLADASVFQLAILYAKSMMQVISTLCKVPCDASLQQVVSGEIVFQRHGTQIYAHHLLDPTVAYEMDKPPYLWIRWLKTIFASKKQRIEEQVPSVNPHVNIEKDQNFNTLLSLLTKLPKVTKLVILRMDDGKIILQVLGTLLDAVITIENGGWIECDTVTKPGENRLRVPWGPKKSNAALGAQMMMIAGDAKTWIVEIVFTGVRLIGLHKFDMVGGIVCFTTPNEVKKISFNRFQCPSLDRQNKNLVVVKTPDSPFDGVIKTIQKRGRDEYELQDGSLLPLTSAQSLDVVISSFKKTGRF